MKWFFDKFGSGLFYYTWLLDFSLDDVETFRNKTITSAWILILVYRSHYLMLASASKNRGKESTRGYTYNLFVYVELFSE